MAMLDEVLKSLCGRLEAALQAAEARSEPWVALSNLVGPDGSPAAGLDDKIVVSLLALLADKGGSSPFTTQPADGRPPPPPPLWLDAYVVVLANFSGAAYLSGLEMISRAISFFQERPVFPRGEMPELPAQVDKLFVEFVSLDLPTAAALLPEGLRTLPFALYRLRRLPFEHRTL
jgi:hypothetical protein